MNRLNEQFSDRVDFFYLNIDNTPTNDLMTQLDIRRRSTYVLLAPDGSELGRWAGPLNEGVVTTQLDEFLVSIDQ